MNTRTLITTIRGYRLVAVVIAGLLLTGTASAQRGTVGASAEKAVEVVTRERFADLKHRQAMRIADAAMSGVNQAATDTREWSHARQRFADFKQRQAMQVADAAMSWLNEDAADTWEQSHARQRFAELKQRQAEQHDTTTR